MLTHVILQLAQNDWVAKWLQTRLGQPYTYVAVADDYLRFTLANHDQYQASIGEFVVWLRDNTDVDTVRLLYVLCCQYDDAVMHSIFRGALTRLLDTSVGPSLYAWKDPDGGVFTVASTKDAPKAREAVWVRDMEDGSYAIWWKACPAMHSVLLAHLKNISVRKPR